MTSLRPFVCDDLLRFGNVNLDFLTETYNLSFYLPYLSKWPELCQTLHSPSGQVMGYLLGKVESFRNEGPESWHGHVTAVTVAPEFRRMGLANRLMFFLENISDAVHRAYFVDLFVRVSNSIAIGMYTELGYSKYRRISGYYSGEEDAFDLRKALPTDKDKKSVIPIERLVMPEELDWD